MVPVASNLTRSSAIPSASVPTVPGSLPTKCSKDALATKSSDDTEREVICIDSDEEMGTLSSSGASSTFSTEAGTSSDQSLSGGFHEENLDTDQVLEEATNMMSDSETRKKALSAIKALASSWTNEPDKTAPLSGTATAKQNTDASLVTARMSAQQGTNGVAVPKGQPPLLLPKARIAPAEVMLKKQEGHTPQEAAVAQALAGFVHFQRRLCKDLHLSPTKQDPKVATNSRSSQVPIVPAVGKRTFPVLSGTLPIPSSASSGLFLASSGSSSNILQAPPGAISGLVPLPPCTTGPMASTVPGKLVLTGHGTSLEHSVTGSGTSHLPAIATLPSVGTGPPKMASNLYRSSSAPPATGPETSQTKVVVSTAHSRHEISTTMTSVPSKSPTPTPSPSIATFISSPTSIGLPSSTHSAPFVSVAQFPSMSSSPVSVASSAAEKSPLQALIERVHYQSRKADVALTYSPTLSTASIGTTTSGSDSGSPSTIMTHNQRRQT